MVTTGEKIDDALIRNSPVSYVTTSSPISTVGAAPCYLLLVTAVAAAWMICCVTIKLCNTSCSVNQILFI